MPQIGNPNEIRNSFKGISKYQGPKRGTPVNPNSIRKDQSVGETLNDIAGAVQENTLHPDATRTGGRLHGRNLRPTDW